MSDHLLCSLRILALSVTYCLASLPAVGGSSSGADSTGGETKEPTKITVWLMPNEPWPNPQAGSRKEQLERFNKSLADSGVTVLNTTDPNLAANLPEPNEKYPTTLDGIRGQRGAIDCLKQFVQKRGKDKLAIDLRFILWEEALALLNAEVAQPLTLSPSRPDIVQIGSTWRARFSPYAHEDSGRLLPNKLATLPYILDVRILYYWKRSVASKSDALDPKDRAPSIRDFKDWKEVIEYVHNFNVSLRARTSEPGRNMPMPIAFRILRRDPDLIHNYIPLVWCGGGRFFDADGGVDLSSDKALTVPRLLRHSVWQPTQGAQPSRLIKFSEDTQYDYQDAFMRGSYGAAILPVNLLPRFHDSFKKNWNVSDPWDHVGLGMLPRMFRGGCDLLVTRKAGSHKGKKELVFALARELASDDPNSEYAHVLAGNGLMPARQEDYGLKVMFEKLSVSGKIEGKHQDMVDSLARYIVKTDRCMQYPDNADWTDRIESPQVLDLLHELWYNIDSESAEDAELDGGLVSQARAVERKLNNVLPLWRRLWRFLCRDYPAIGVIVLLVIVLTVLLFLFSPLVRFFPRFANMAAIARWEWLTGPPPDVLDIPICRQWVLWGMTVVRFVVFDFSAKLRKRLLESWISRHYAGPPRVAGAEALLMRLIEVGFGDKVHECDFENTGRLDDAAVPDAVEQYFREQHLRPRWVVISVLVAGDSDNISEEDLASELLRRILTKPRVMLKKAPCRQLVSSLLEEQRLVVIVKVCGPSKDGDRIQSIRKLVNEHATMLRMILTDGRARHAKSKRKRSSDCL